MLSASFGQLRVRAESPPASRTSAKYAQRWDASEFHCTAVCPGPSFLTPTDTWQNRQSTDTRPESGSDLDRVAVASRNAAARAGSDAKLGALDQDPPPPPLGS